jgi:CBS domain-containing protein
MIELDDILDEKNDDVITVPSGLPIQEAATLLANHEVGIVLVTDPDHAVCGVLSERDITAGVAKLGAAIADKTADDLMTSPVISCTSTDSVIEILVLMKDNHIRHLPVIDDGALIGMLSLRDIQTAWLNSLDRECELLRRVEAA